MFHSLSYVRVAALRASVPTKEISLDDEHEYYNGNPKKIARLKATFGMDKRRICPTDVTASDLCAHAARDLFAAFPQCQKQIDALVFVSQWPDWRQPATACELQHRLGLPKTCAAFDLNQGCSGYVYGLWIGASLVAAGAARQVLLLVGDTPSMNIDLRNRVTAPIFGDAGSATLLQHDATAPPMFFGLGTDGSGFEAIIIPGGGARIPFGNDSGSNRDLLAVVTDENGNVWRLHDTYMDGGAVFDFTQQVVPANLLALLKFSDISHEQIDNLFLHQANRQIVTNIAEKAGFKPDCTPTGSFGKYGNTASASLPLAMSDFYGNGNISARIALCGYGIGLSWAACLCELSDLNCKVPLDFVADPQIPARKQRIERWQQIMQGKRKINE